MTERETNPQAKHPILPRVARIWSGVIIGVGVLVFIGEFLEGRSVGLGGYPFYENLIPLALLISLLGLALAWRWPLTGALITIIAILVSNGVYWITGREARLVVVLIHLPILIPAVLFLVGWWQEKASTA